MPMDLRARLTELARIERAATPVVSVYLNTRWADEHQRGRVRVFLKNALAQARRAPGGRAAGTDLDWIQAQGDSLVAQARLPDAHGVALFACEALGLREIIAVSAPFEDKFIVADGPFLGPLAAMLQDTPNALVLFLDTESARLIPFGTEGAGEDVSLQSEVPGHHSRGGWAQLAQSRYQRHIQEHRMRHFDAVAESLAELLDTGRIERIVIAGEPKNIALFRKSLPSRIARLIVGAVSGARDEPAGAIVARAAGLLDHAEGQRQAEEVDAVLTDAAKGGQAVAGLASTLEAVNRGAVHRLYLLKGFGETGRICLGCGALQPGSELGCRHCGQEVKAVDLAEAMSDRVIAANGRVEMIEAHQALARAGGPAARLRYPL